MSETEIWNTIPGYEGYYEASSFGRIKSLFRKYVRKNGAPITTKERIRSQNISRGYLSVTLRKESTSIPFRVHQLVAMAFLGHVRSGFIFVIDHIDGNKLNNDISNLQIVTNRDNTTICFKKNRSELASQYVGVSWNIGDSKWQSFIVANGQSKYLGSFTIETKASEAYQKALLHIKDNTIDAYLDSIKPKFSSKYKGVTWDKNRNKWASRIMVKRKITNIGRFNTELEASNAYQKTLLNLK
jgi:hypothetical protein